MTPHGLTFDLKFGFVKLMLKRKVYRMTFLIMDSGLRSSLVSWTSAVVVVVENAAIKWATEKSVIVVATCA
jgi:hypothetical protein